MGGSKAVRQRLLLTLLFLGAVGLHRTWDLRSYTADGLALLTGRKRAYGYRYTEAFLSQVAHFDSFTAICSFLADWLGAWERFLAAALWSCSTINKDIPCLLPHIGGISI